METLIRSKLSQVRVIIATLSVALSTLYSAQATAQADSGAKLADLLRPYVRQLDRDLWTFRYEAKDSFRPRNVDDLAQRIGNWANRFYNPDIRRGADTGPGVYVAMDPVATATWGREMPRLFAIKIKRGVRTLIGDQNQMPAELLNGLRELSKEMGCAGSSTSMEYGLGHAVGFFRMNEKAECREAIVRAIQNLSVQAISYGFNSAPLVGCRTTGTAISIINSEAVALNELNRYSEDGNIEGQPAITPYVAKLFDEAKSDFYSQSLLANLEVWTRYKNAYGFFSKSPAVDPQAYQKWKNQSIYRCGAQWSIEVPEPQIEEMIAQKRLSHPQVSDLAIRLSLVYREKAEVAHSAAGVPPELNLRDLRIVRQKVRPGSEIKLATAQVPEITGNPKQDEQEFIGILRDCLNQYMTKPFAEVVQGQCGPE